MVLKGIFKFAMLASTLTTGPLWRVHDHSTVIVAKECQVYCNTVKANLNGGAPGYHSTNGISGSGRGDTLAMTARL